MKEPIMFPEISVKRMSGRTTPKAVILTSLGVLDCIMKSGETVEIDVAPPMASPAAIRIESGVVGVGRKYGPFAMMA